MRTFTDMQPQLSALCGVLEKYVRVSRTPVDFGGGEPLFPQEIHFVSACAWAGGASVSDLCRRFGTTRGAASQMVGKLVRKGLLAKRRDPEKGSRLIVEPTEKGLAAHRAHMAFHEVHDGRFLDFLAGLCTEEYEVFAALCGEMGRWMDSYLCETPGCAGRSCDHEQTGDGLQPPGKPAHGARGLVHHAQMR